jgi:ketosteroid isomerase-like protein
MPTGDTGRAMSQENVEAARRAFEAVDRHNLDAYLALMDPNVEITSRLIGQGTFYGHDGAREWWGDMLGILPDLRMEVRELRDLGELVFAVLHLRGHGAGSDAPFDEAVWVTAKMQNGMCVWWRAHNTEAEALEAAGLRE